MERRGQQKGQALLVSSEVTRGSHLVTCVSRLPSLKEEQGRNKDLERPRSFLIGLPLLENGLDL